MNDNKNQLREDAIEFAIQISDLCDEITVLNFGTVLAEGQAKTVLQNPEVIKAYIGG